MATEQILEFNISLNSTAIDGEELSIHYLKFDPHVEDLENTKEGDFIGIIHLQYPIAGLNVNLSLEVFQGFCEEYQSPSGSFKLPFVDKKVFLFDVEYEAYHTFIFDDFDHVEDDEYGKCSCGGSFLPMYDEFPNWIQFCNRCDSRTEDGDYSPLPY